MSGYCPRVMVKTLHIANEDDGIEGVTIGSTRCRIVGTFSGAHTPRFCLRVEADGVEVAGSV